MRGEARARADLQQPDTRPRRVWRRGDHKKALALYTKLTKGKLTYPVLAAQCLLASRQGDDTPEALAGAMLEAMALIAQQPTKGK